MHDTQLPPRQTRFAPQLVPSGWFEPLSVQVAAPVVQLSVPVWHGLDVGVHAPPAVQVTQLPALQTMFEPHDVPSVAGVPA